MLLCYTAFPDVGRIKMIVIDSQNYKMIIKTAVIKPDETDSQSDSHQQAQSGPSIGNYVETKPETKYHFLQTNESFDVKPKSCNETIVVESQSSIPLENPSSEECYGRNKDAPVDDIVDNIINAEILHNLCTKLTGFPVDSYRCESCGEMFLSKSGCSLHLNRKSAHIVHVCSVCETSIEFFNRCEFLLHIKNHGIIPTSEYLKKTTEFKVIAESKYLNFEYGEREEDYQYYSESAEDEERFRSSEVEKMEIPSSENNINAHQLDSDKEENTIQSLSVQDAYSSVVTPKILHTCNDNNNHVINSSYDQLRNEYWCSSCGVDYVNAEEFFQHVKEREKDGANAKTLYHCNIDNIPSYSHCKYILHNRVIHGRYGPFVCPECGNCFDNWMTLYDHAKYECFHLSQSVLYSCVIEHCGQNGGAKEFYSNSKDLLKHYEKEHFRYVLQCIYCTQAFATYEWLFKHLLTDNHSVALSETAIRDLSKILDGNESNVSTDIATLTRSYSKKLIQCLICNIVFCNDLSYNQHFSAKFSDHSDSKIIFTCGGCSQQFDRRTVFKEHLVKNSACNNKLKENENDQSETNNAPKESDAINNKVNPSSEKGCKISSRTYRPRPKPLRIQPARAVATPTIANISNPNDVLSASVNIKNGSFLRSHITQQCHYCRKSFDLSVIKKHESSCSKLQLDPGYCLACKQTYQGSLLLWHHGKNHIKNGLKICLFCNNREMKFHGQMFQEEATDCDVLEEHLYSVHVLNAKLPYKCLLCKDAIAVKEDLYVHLKKHHNLSTIDSFQVKRSRSFQISQLPRTNTKGKNNTAGKGQLQSPLKRESLTIISERDLKNGKKRRITCETQPESKSSDLTNWIENDCNGDHTSKEERELSEQSIKVEKLNTSQYDSKPIPFVPLVTKTQNARENGTFNCFKCTDFSAKTEDDFCNHIRFKHVLSDQEEERHYNGGIGVFPVEFRDFWCPECDISFVVKPSLVKHLQFSHNYIENVDEYMKRVGYDSKRPLKEHQCEICYLRCSDSVDQYNHMKSHGMAFLRLRQQRKASD